MLAGTSIPLPSQVNWMQAQTKTLSEKEALHRITLMLQNMPGQPRQIIIKPAKGSGGRGIIVVTLRTFSRSPSFITKDGKEGGLQLDVEALKRAVEEIYFISTGDDVVVQTFLVSDPRQLVSEETWVMIKQRFVQVGVGLRDEEDPVFCCLRTSCSQGPNGQGPRVSAYIMLVSVSEVANFGQGSLMFEFSAWPEMEALREVMRRQSVEMFRAYESYSSPYGKDKGIPPSSDLAGNSYCRPTSLLLDWLVVKGEGAELPQVYAVEQNIGMIGALPASLLLLRILFLLFSPQVFLLFLLFFFHARLF